MTGKRGKSPIADFDTARLWVRDWQADLADPAARRVLVTELAAILTPPVLAHLPPPLHLENAPGAVSAWVCARADEAAVHTVRARSDAALLGLLILSPQAATGGTPPALHLGYLFGESAWGRGYATELVRGLVTAVRDGPPVDLVGGVDSANPASARVLEKCGFVASPTEKGAATTLYTWKTPRC
jgi:RimJ/RimL family protein N-acetyltransferase